METGRTGDKTAGGDVTRWRHGAKPVIGLIGPIGAGKSTVARCFERRGGRVIDADALGHAALEQPVIVERIVTRWGDAVRKPDGSLDRRAIAGLVFANPDERSALEGMVFPFIAEKCRDRIAGGLADPAVRFLLLDAAVMLEAGWHDAVDRIVYVDAPREARVARVAARGGWTAAELAAREAAQWPADRKLRYADAVVRNDAGPDGLQPQVDDILTRWGLLEGSRELRTVD
jgi:dephospho-CoA kinase